MASRVEVSLGKNIDVIERNIKLIKAVEHARIDLWVANNNTNTKDVHIPEITHIIETGEHSLEELIQHDEDNIDDWDKLRGTFSPKKRET